VSVALVDAVALAAAVTVQLFTCFCSCTNSKPNQPAKHACGSVRGNVCGNVTVGNNNCEIAGNKWTTNGRRVSATWVAPGVQAATNDSANQATKRTTHQSGLMKVGGQPANRNY